jgi:HK97 family phage prohead protease
MKIEVREDSVHISGYVNAIERFSKPIRETLHGKIRTFIERIKAGVFKTALKRNDNVLVLLNHNHNRVLANTKDGTAILEEDNIGLRAEVTITDAEVVEKARNNQLVGWSFGFCANSDELGIEGNNETRTVTDLDLFEVSILDDTKSPAYYGTSIEARSNDNKILEYRSFIKEEGEEVDKELENQEEVRTEQVGVQVSEQVEKIEQEAIEKHEEIYEVTEQLHKSIEEEKKEAEFNLLVEAVYQKVLEKINGTRAEEIIEEPVEETVEEVPEEDGEKRAIDYSDFERRIAELN